MKLKSTALKTGLLLLIGAGLIGCSVLGNYNDEDRIDYAVKIEFREMPSLDFTAPVNDPDGWNSTIEVKINDATGNHFEAIEIDASLFHDDYFDYWLREQSNENIMSFPYNPSIPWHTNSAPLYIVLTDSKDNIVYSNNQFNGEMNKFDGTGDTLVVTIYGSQISTNSNSWQ